MKNLVKLFACLLSLVLVVALGACGEKEEKTPTPDENVAFEDELIEKGKLIVSTSTDYAPYEFVDLTKEGQEKFVGSDMELARFIANELGLELEIKSMDFNVCLTAVDSGKADISICGLTYEEDRAKSFLFSDSYFLEGEGDQILVVKKENASKYSTLQDFNKKEVKVAVQSSSVQESLAEAQLPEANLIKITDLQATLALLEAGQYDAVAMSYNGATTALSTNDALQIVENVKFVQDDSNLYILTTFENDQLMEAINEVLVKVNEDNMYEKWMNEAKALFADLGDNAGELIPEEKPEEKEEEEGAASAE